MDSDQKTQGGLLTRVLVLTVCVGAAGSFRGFASKLLSERKQGLNELVKFVYLTMGSLSFLIIMVYE